MRCTQPGCTGTIVDGYCDVCGSPGPQGQAVRDRGRRPGQRAGRRLCPARLHRHHRGRLLRRLRQSGRRAPRRSRRPRSATPAGPVSTRTGSSRLNSTALGSRRAVAGGSKITRRVQSGSQRLRSARLGAGLTRVPPAPVVDAAAGDHEEPGGAGGQAHLPELRRTGRPVPGRPARAHRGLLRQLRPGVLVHPEAAARRPGGQPVRGGRLPGPRRPRLDLPGPGQERLRPLGGAQGPAEHRRQGRARRSDRRAAVPGPGRAPADRGDLQLRHPRRGRLHRHGVRRRHLAEADPEEPDAGQQRSLRPAPGGPGAGVHPRGPAGLLLPARPRAWSTATSSRTT